jgi:hypothetical protein
MVEPAKEVTVGLHPLRSRCSECKRSFRPNARLKLRQKTCVEVICQRKHRARYRQEYRLSNPGPEKEYRDKVKAGRRSNFWNSYRKSHPGSSERNRQNTKLRKQLKRVGLQRQLDIVQVIDPPGYFELFHRFATSHRSLLDACRATHAA